MSQGIITAAHGRQYVVLLDDGECLLAFPRGKKSEIACGDRVLIEKVSDNQAVILKCLPRKNLLYRANAFRQKLIAANLDQVLIVVAGAPPFSDELLSRTLLAAESESISAKIVLNKSDLVDATNLAREKLQPFLRIGYPLIELSAKSSTSDLKPFLKGCTSLLVGQSGMGKSTLINALIPEANAPTREISEALQAGKHTTTHATRYALDGNSFLIDSPGMQTFGLSHLKRAALTDSFPEFRPYLQQCRFRNCRHGEEPDCTLRNAVDSGKVDKARLALYQRLLAENEGQRTQK